MAPDSDHPTRILIRTRTLWGDLCLDAVACEGSRLIRPKGDAVDGGCVFQNSRTRLCIKRFRILDFRAFQLFDVLTAYARAALQTLRSAPPVSASVRTSSCVNHMQIPSLGICAKFQEYREDMK